MNDTTITTNNAETNEKMYDTDIGISNESSSLGMAKIVRVEKYYLSKPTKKNNKREKTSSSPEPDGSEQWI